ncbi:hypothetical protein BGW41_005342 [Actinomortierella wolfii]|nr:hypothetical protein BGW41_005342 [Actinomortierella wolfii]
MLIRTAQNARQVQLSTRLTRPLHSTIRSLAQETSARPPSSRVPRPIPLDIGAGSTGSVYTTAPASSSSTIASSSSARRRQEGGFFYKYGSPIFTIAVFASASTLVLHILYHHLALEEYQLASTQKIKELEAEINELKSQKRSGQIISHASGGRGEFI